MSHPAAPQPARPATAPPPAPPRPAAAPGVPGAAAPPATGAAGAPTGQPESSYVDTPGMLNRLQLVGMAVAIGFGVLSALLQLLAWEADGRAADDTEQLVRIQEIRSSLLRADALATNGFLVSGLEDPGQRQEYDDAIDDVLTRIAEAAQAQPADREALAALNVQVADYATAIAQARDYNRQGYPVGVGYLTVAGDALRDRALPVLDALVAANTERAEGAMQAQHPWWLLLLGGLALVALLRINQRLARLFHRRVNVGVALAVVIVLLTTLVTVTLGIVRAEDNDELRAGAFRAAVDQAEARTAANDAKANESIRLIKRGSGAEYEDAWRASAEVVADRADPTTLNVWRIYVQRHERIVALDDQDRWGQARALATTPQESGSTAPLDAFDAASARIVDEAGAEATDRLRSGRALALALALLTLGLGVVAAVAVARGIGERRKEYL